MVQRPIMFAYWGSRGALPKLALELARVAAARQDIACTFSLARTNELFEEFAFLQNNLLTADVLKGGSSLVSYRRIIKLRSSLLERIGRDGTQAYVSLMSHLWSPLIAPALRDNGVRHVAVVHDGDPHPGDLYAMANWWLLREAIAADRVVTLSNWVARRLTARHGIPPSKISTLFHPDLDYAHNSRASGVNSDDPLRALFLGRIMPYKGLELFVGAAELLRQSRIELKLGVFGSGRITSSLQRRLGFLDAEVVNRWLSHAEIDRVLSSYDVVVAAHTEASQSGIIAAAFGAGVPVVTTPVGGLIEQVTPGVTGIIAESTTSRGLADAIGKIAENRELLKHLREGVSATRSDRSMERFFGRICEIALQK